MRTSTVSVPPLPSLVVSTLRPAEAAVLKMAKVTLVGNREARASRLRWVWEISREGSPGPRHTERSPESSRCVVSLGSHTRTFYLGPGFKITRFLGTL